MTKILDFLEIFRKRRIKLIKQQTKETQKLITMQETLNDLLRQEKEIESN